MGYGFSGYFGLARETTWGSATNATRFVEILNENLTRKINRFEFKNVIGTMAQPDDKSGMHMFDGSVAFSANPEAIGPFLMSLFNTVTVTSLGNGLHKHVYKQPTNSNSAFSAKCPTVPYTFEIFRDVNSAIQYAGGVVKDMSINFAPDQDVRMTCNLLARSERSATAQTPTFPSSPAFPFTFDTVSLSLAGAATSKIENLTVNIDNQFEGLPALDMATVISKIRRGGFQLVNVSGSIDFSDHDEYNMFIAQSEFSIKANATVANSFSLLVDLPRLVFTSFPLGISGRGRNVVDFEAKAFYHAGSGTGIAVTLTTVSSYF